MFVSTRHTRGGYYTVMSILQNPQEPSECRARALRSAFVWSDQPIGEEFWHRAWTALSNRCQMPDDAKRLITSMANSQPKTIFAADARDHDRITLKEIARLRLAADMQKAAA